jgi:type II secretion system protein N
MTGWKRNGLIAVLFVATFALGLFVTFPMTTVARIVEAQAESALSHRYAVHVGRASYSFPLGLRLRNVRMESTEPLMEGEVRLPTQFDSVRVGVSFFSLLRGRVRVTGDIRMGDGRAQVAWGPGGDGTQQLDLSLRRFQLDRVDLIRQTTGMPMRGQVEGDVRLVYNEQMRLSGGEAEIAIARLQVGPGMVKCPDACRRIGGVVPIPGTDFGPVAVKVSIDRSTLTVERLETSGEDIQVEIGGRVDLRDPLRASRLDLSLRLALNSRYVEEHGLASPLSEVQLMRNAQTANGYMLRLSGVGRNVRVEAAGGAR